VNTTHADALLPAPAMRLEPRALSAGARGQLIITLDIPAGVHLQSHAPTEPFLIPTTLHLDATPDVTFGPVDYPTPHTERFDWTPVRLDVYRGTIEIVVPIAVAPTWSGATTIAGQLHYQACTEHSCLPPAHRPIEVSLPPLPELTELSQ
jgi:DsbC/DsbD-like thiol-disulfide interchange protein